jgi:lysozyme
MGCANASIFLQYGGRTVGGQRNTLCDAALQDLMEKAGDLDGGGSDISSASYRRALANYFNMNDDLEKEFESCRLAAYLDTMANPPIWTIGWGHTGKDVYEGLIWTQEQADEALDHDIRAAVALLDIYSPGLTGGTADALTDFVFNMGIGNYRTSTLCGLVGVADWVNVKTELLKWDHSNGVVIPGLLRRRKAEAALINT